MNEFEVLPENQDNKLQIIGLVLGTLAGAIIGLVMSKRADDFENELLELEGIDGDDNNRTES